MNVLFGVVLAESISGELACHLQDVVANQGMTLVRDRRLLADDFFGSGIPCIAFVESEGDGSQCESLRTSSEAYIANVPLILMVREPSFEAAVSAMQQGAFTVLRFPIDADAVRAAIQGAFQLSKRLAEQWKSWKVVSDQLNTLTEGELQVLRFVMEGFLNKRIASRLEISERTVEARRKRIFQKTDTHSVAHLVRRIVESVGAEVVLRSDSHQTRPPAPHWHMSTWRVANRFARAIEGVPLEPRPGDCDEMPSE